MHRESSMSDTRSPVDQVDDAVIHQSSVPLGEAFEDFIDEALIASWLAEKARVETRSGGGMSFSGNSRSRERQHHRLSYHRLRRRSVTGLRVDQPMTNHLGKYDNRSLE